VRCLITISGSRLARARLGSRVSVSTSAQAGVVLGEESNVYRPRNHRSHRDHRPGHLDDSPLTRQRRRAWPAALGVSARGHLLEETAASSIGRTMQALVSGELVLDSQKTAALFRAEKAVRDAGTALLAKISLRRPRRVRRATRLPPPRHGCHAGRAGVSPASWAPPREPCAATRKTFTNGFRSPAAPPRSPVPSPTGWWPASGTGRRCARGAGA
jgi:hypothetical protein